VRARLWPLLVQILVVNSFKASPEHVAARKAAEGKCPCLRKEVHTVWCVSVRQDLGQLGAAVEDRTQIGMRSGEGGIPCHQQRTIHHCSHLS
jgi:hypothetical protein